jgi:DnaA family protein
MVARAARHHPQQLPLQVQLPDDELFSTYFAGANGEAVAWLKQLASQTNEPDSTDRYSWLSGPVASGKSHLLHATVAAASAAGTRVMYLPVAEFADVTEPRSLLDGVNDFQLLLLDDIDHVLTASDWCFELFALLNSVLDRGTTRVVMSASQAAVQTDVELADLKSRLQWSTAYQLQPLSDDDKARALILRAHWRGLDLPMDVALFMLHRLGRDMRALLRSLNTLDTASIAAQRRLTIPFVKQALTI